MITTHNVGQTTSSSSSAPFVELDHTFPSRVADISALVDNLMQFITAFMGNGGMARATEEELEIAVHEALANAVIHGNHESPDKKVHLSCRCSMDGELLITVRDEGEGFDWRAIPDPTESHRSLLPYGRGLHLMRALMDEVSFEENGRVVRMRKRMKAQPRSL